MSIENSKLVSVLINCISIPILYFSVSEMNFALEVLDKNQTQAAIEKRCKSVKNEKWQSQYIDQFYNKVNLGINIVSQANLYSSDKDKEYFKNYSYNLILMWTKFGYESSYDATDTGLLRIRALKEFKSNIILEAKDARKHFSEESSDATKQLDNILKANTASAKKLGEVIKTHFDKNHIPELLTYSELTRIVFVVPKDDRLKNYILSIEGTIIPWENGFFTEWSVSDLPELQTQVGKMQVVYLQYGSLLYDVEELTDEQFKVSVNRNIKQYNSNPKSLWFPYLYSLELNYLWHLAQTLDFLKIKHPELYDDFYDEFTYEIDELIVNLSKYSNLKNDSINSRQTAVEALIENEKNIIEDSEFFSMVTRCDNAKEISFRLSQISIKRHSIIETLKKLLN